MKTSTRRFAALVVAGGLLVGCSASGSSEGGDTTTEPSGSETTNPSPDTTEGPDITEPSDPDPTTTTTTTTTEPDDDDDGGDQGSKDSPLDLGTTATLSDWDVEVTDVVLDATDELLKVETYNEKPEKDRYVLASVSVTYNGDDEGDAGFDLNYTLQGDNGKQYRSSGCQAVTANPTYQAPTLTEGGETTIDICWDVDKDVKKGSSVFVEFQPDDYSKDPIRAYWAVT